MSQNRVQVAWTSAHIVGGGLSTFYFDSAVGTAAQQVAAVGTFLTATDDRRISGTTWATLPDVATLSVAGALEGTTSTTPATGTGSLAGTAVPQASQGLLRLITGAVVGGRLLRGRLFLPAVGVNDNTNGVPSATYVADYNAAAAALIADANTNWIVWSQTHGFSTAIVSATVWSKFAVLRSRRD